MNSLDVLALAKKHSIRKELPSPDFFEGALLGNGDLGVVVCTCPDSIVLYLGHNSIWDIRVEEGHKDKIKTFDEIWARIRATEGDIYQVEWFKQYMSDVTDSYLHYKYPRPYPASALHLFFDRKENEILGHSLDLSNGLLTITAQTSTGEIRYISVFVSQQSDTVYCRTVDENGKEVPFFYAMHLMPHEPDEGLPAYEQFDNGFFQLLPYNNYNGEMRPGVDKAFSVLYAQNGTTSPAGDRIAIHGMTQFLLQVTEGDCEKVKAATEVKTDPFEAAWEQSAASWERYWNCSAVALSDEYLEHLWYTNTYFMRCLLNASSRCPGLFGNWMYKDIGTAWHGDYHMNYNTQQVFWGLMSSNRQELHFPYVELAENLLPLSQNWAKEFYHLDGACFPHSAYPVPMSVMPYPSPDWGWEIFETPWTVQSLWWHYTYTKDLDLLRNRLWPVIHEAAAFLAAYMTREGSNPVGDDKYHLFPTIVPEKYGISEGLVKNLDCAVDLTFTKFIFRSALQAVKDLRIETEEATLTQTIEKILAAYPEYPTADSKWGKIYVSVQTEDPENVIYNCPANLMQIFPGEDIDAQSASAEDLEIAKTSWYHHYNEGGNDIVFYYLIGARLGILDLEKFKHHVRYCTMPNDTVTDRVTLTGGRYYDDVDYDFMARMGIWVENFSLYAVVNECLLWGHTDIIELFPNWDKHKAASFQSLRTKGAFLVSAACANGTVSYVTVHSECGGRLQLKNPWAAAKDQYGTIYTKSLICMDTTANSSYTFTEM